MGSLLGWLFLSIAMLCSFITDSLAQCNTPPCGVGEVEVQVKITTDNYPNETSWVINDLTTGLPGCGISPFGDCTGGLNGPPWTLSANTTYTWTLCYPAGNVLEFIIADASSDGICCGFGTGSYEVNICGGITNIVTGGAFGCDETTTFTLPGDCCGGGVCTNGIQDGNETGVDCGGPCCPSCPPISASDCSDAVDVCTNLDFQIQPDGYGLIMEIPPLGSLGNPNNANPGGSGNWGCLRAIPQPEKNSTWMIVTIDNPGMLEFTMGGNGTQAGFYDWIMYPWSPTACADIPNNTVAPVRCNWNGVNYGGTGLAGTVPVGGDISNYEPPLPVNCGDKFFLIFSNWSSVITNVPLEFYGTASVTCSPTTLMISVIPPNPTICLGESVTLTANGADTYTWSPATGLSATTGTSVIANPTVTTTYTVTGQTGCVTGDTTVTVVVQSPNAGFTYSGSQCLSTNSISFTNTGDAPGSCGGGCPTYTWDFGDGTGSSGTNSGAANPAHTYLSAGVFTVTQIVDDGSCIATFTQDIIISDPVSSVFGTEESCTNGCDGAVNLTVLGGTAPLTYLWSNGAGTEDIVDLCSGTYSVTVTDGIGCTTTSGVTLNPIVDVAGGFTYNGNQCLLNNSYQFTNTGDAPGSCGPNCPTYWWDFGDGTNLSGTTTATANPTHTYTTSGSYTVTQVITDAGGCSDTSTLTLQVLDPPVAMASGVDETCVNACNGTATVTTTGGAPIAIYNWNPVGSTQNISGLCAGAYLVTVTDLNGCQDSSSVIINSGTDIKAGFSYNGDQCLNGNSYAFTNLGTVPSLCGMGCPTFYWDFGDATTQSGTNSSAANPTHIYSASGTYAVTQIVSDGTCSDTMVQIITVYPEPTISIVPTNLSCAGACDGSADLTMLTGTPPYTYVWTNFETAQDLHDVCAGTYGVTVTDSAGCTVTGTVTITDPPAMGITLTPTDPSCNGTCDGSISPSVSGGSAPYTYQWNDPGNQTVATATGLCAGTFMLLVTDANGCSDSDTVSLTTPPILTDTVSGSDASCNGVCDGDATITPGGGTPGYTYSWDDPGFQTTATATGLCDGTYNVTLTNANGCQLTDLFVVGEPAAIVITPSGTAATCGNPDGTATATVSGGTAPYTYLWNDPGTQTDSTATGLAAGGYNVTVTDNNGCTKTAVISVTDAGAPTATISDSTLVLCFGGSNGDATVLAGGGTPPYTYSWNTSPVQTNAQATGLGAGTYTATVSDNVGCVATATVVITQPPLLNTSVTASVNPGCNLACDGSATSSTSGGTPPYTYAWDDPGTQSTAMATGLCDGAFNILVTDANGCTDNAPVTLTEPTALALSHTQVDVSCNGGADGSIDLSVSGGTPAYTYAWSNSASAQDLTNLAQGTYTVTVTDSKGCSDNLTVVITEPLAIVLTPSSTDANCGQSAGGVSIGVAGGTGAYTYLWDDPGASTSASVATLPAGTYNVTVTDGNGCFTSATAIVLNIPGGSASAVVDNDASGFGICDAQATAGMTGGAAPYTYVWDDPAAQTTATAAGLCAGSNCVTVTDANGCSDTACVTISEPAAVVLSIIGTDILCFGDCNGAADLTVTGGVPPYTYLWNPGGMTAQDVVNLCTGTYSVDVTDASGLVTGASVTIAQPLAPLAATVTGTNILCNGQFTGAIDLSVSGGTGPYTYLWSPGGEVTEDLSNLGPGNYTVTVTDSNGCTTTAGYTVTQATPVVLTGTPTDANCGQPDGQASVSATGGSAPYTYAWNTSPQQTTATATGLPAGSYSVVVTDASGCLDSTVVNISDVGGGTASVVTDNDALCFGNCDGQASISITGGTAPFTYLWNDPAAQTVAVATGLCAGSYNVSATDAVGCLLTGSAVINEPGAIVLGVTGSDANCAGTCDGGASTSVSGGTLPYTYAWSTSPVQVTANAAGLCAGSFSVTLTDSNSCTTVAPVVIGEPLPIAVSITAVTSYCGQANGQATASVTNGTAPYSYLWSDPLSQSGASAIGLLAGTYFVTVTDATGCTGTASAAVSDTMGPLASVVTNIGVSCPGGNDGSLTVFVNDGSPPYTYSWNDPLNQTATTASGLVEGTYVVTVIDSAGCTTTASASIVAPPPLNAAITAGTDPTCNGLCDGTATVTASGGTIPYTYLWNDPGAQTGSVAAALCTGAFIATATDGNGCTDTANITITAPSALSVMTSPVAASCAGVCDGSLSSSVSGGTGPYTYSWDDPATQSTSLATALCAGVYNATVTDANGCTSLAANTVTEPVALVSSVISAAGVSCNGSCNGSAEIAVVGGTSPLTYLWSSGQTAALATNLCGGAATVDITDANGCTITDGVVIPEPAALTNTFTSTNVDCNGNATGVATANISGGTVPYMYLWNDLNLQTTASATGLTAGTYTVQVTDSNGCTLSGTTTLTQPVALAVVIDTNGANCGLSDGSACVTMSAGVAPFSYQWDDPGTQTTACATGISSGTYNVTVTDNSGCTITGLAIVSDLGAPNLIISSYGDANCNGGCDGFATVQILNGDPPYTYSWNDPANQTTAMAGGLCTGTYVVNILDSNSCSGNISVTIGQPAMLNAVISGQTAASCNGACDGAATALASGGTPPYTYQWNDPGLQTTQTASGLCAGSYGLTVIDANGCTDTTSVTITEPSVITLSTVIVNAHCGLSDGSATVTATGGNGLYAYLWDDPASQNTATASGIAAGPYTVIVTDVLGCSASATVAISDLPPGVPSIPVTTDVSCNGGNDGSATVSMAGGTLPFTYLWDDPLGQTTATAMGLGSGVFTVSVTDANGCLVTASTSVNEPVAVSVIITGIDVSCKVGCDGSASAAVTGGTGAYTYQWDDPLAQTNMVASGLCAGNVSVIVSDNYGCTDTGYVTLGEPDSILLTESHSDANCGQADGIATVSVTGGTAPYSYLWSPGGQTTPFISNISAGTYIVTVTDANLCTAVLPVTVSDLNGPGVSITSSSDVDCSGGNNGQATALATGGTPTFTYSWNDPLNQSTPAAGNLPVGLFTVTVVDANGCIASTTVNIGEPPPIIFNPSLTNPTCFGDCNGTAGVTAAGGTPPYQYLWNDPAAQTTPIATGLCSGTYIGVITDANACTKQATIAISNPSPVTASVSSTDETCFGSCDGSLTAAPNNGTSPYGYQWNDPFSQITQTAGGLCTGTYSVTISDNNGCTATASGTVNGPVSLSVSISSSGNNPCAGNCQGYAQSLVSGGSAPFTYLWSDGQTAAQAVNLCAGSYTVTVTDANGCNAQTSVTITQPQGMALNITGNNISCNSACDGTATASVSGGVPPYTYLWNDGMFQTTATALSLCAGAYSVTVSDVSGCTQTGNIILTQPQILGLNSTSTSSTCGFSNGSACVNVIGGSSPYVITWNDPNTTPGACVFNVFAGIYNPVVSDANGCTYTMPVVINDIVGPTVDSVTGTDVICAQDSNGTATVFATGVALPLTYDWKDNSGTTIATNVTTAFGLWGGTYSITVSDANGCVSGALISISEPAILTSAVVSATPASCNGDCNGMATIMAGGGITPYSYLWTDGQITATALGLCAGTHGIIVTDANGCQDINAAVISEPAPLLINDSVNNVSCFGFSDGSVYTSVTGGTPFYSYSWSPSGGNNNSAVNLIAQVYTVSVLDIRGCTATATVTVGEPLYLTATATSDPATCGINNGTATVSVSGGTLPYSYIWDNPLNTTSGTATGLLPRDPYYATVTDANGCILVIPVTVSDEPGPLVDSVSTVNITCNGLADGSATVYFNSGTPPFTYLWDDPATQTTISAFNLGAGTVGVVVTDSNGCTTSALVVITEPAPLAITTSPDVTICYGDSATIWASGSGGTLPYSTFIWTNQFAGNTQTVGPLTTTTYTVLYSDANTCPGPAGTVEVTVNPMISISAPDIVICESEDAILTASASGGAGGPYTYTWSNGYIGSQQTVTGLMDEDDMVFTVSVTDSCALIVDTVVYVTVNPAPEITFDSDGSGCYPYVFVAYTSLPDSIPIISWLWDFGDGTTSNDSGATFHEYTDSGTFSVTLTVTSIQGCTESYTEQGAAVVYPLPTADFIMTQNGTIITPPVIPELSPWIDFVNASTGNIDSVYWNFDDPASGSENTSDLVNPSHVFTDTGTYSVLLVVVTDNGCIDSVRHKVLVEGEFILFAPNAFTPNGDGDNDYFMPKGIGVQEETFEMYIYDRWGDLIARVVGEFGADPMIGWDGRANDGQKEAQIDVYVWLIRTEDVNRVAHDYVGHVTLLR